MKRNKTTETDYGQLVKNLRERAADPKVWGDKIQKEWTLDWSAADAIEALSAKHVATASDLPEEVVNMSRVAIMRAAGIAHPTLTRQDFDRFARVAIAAYLDDGAAIRAEISPAPKRHTISGSDAADDDDL